MENCSYYEELVSAVLDGEATEEEETALFAHLEGCGSCRAYYEALRALSLAAEDGLPDPPADFTARVMERVRAAEKPRKKAAVIRFPVRSLAVAAAAALVLWAGFHVTLGKGMGSAASESPRAGEQAAYSAKARVESAGVTVLSIIIYLT